MIVPTGDQDKMTALGFRRVQEVTWYNECNIKTANGSIKIRVTPADHWTNRTPFDGGSALVNGYAFSTEELENDKRQVVYFAGDTAKPQPERFQAICDIISYNTSPSNLEIINLQPGGPNYSRQDMKSTHQSIVESALTHFRIFFKIFYRENEKLEMDKYITTSIMHHNKYELGPDRFNENSIIIEEFKALFTLKGDINNIGQLKGKIKGLEEKSRFDHPHGTNPSHPDQSFIYQGALELINMFETFQKDISVEDMTRIITTELDRIVFPLIGEKVELQRSYMD